MPKQMSEPSPRREISEHERSFIEDEEDQGPIEIGTVARGRTLLQIKKGPLRILGFTKDGKAVQGPKYVELVEGQPFSAPQAEIRRLRDLGYLFDQSKVASDDQAKALDKNGEPVVGSGGVGFVNAGQPA